MAPDHEDQARQLEDLRQQQRAISGVLRALARSSGIQPVLDEVVEACKRLCKADYGALYLLEHELLHTVAHHGEAEGAEYDREHPHALDRTTAAGRAAVTRMPVHIPDIRNDAEYSYGGPTEYYRAILGVPIIVEDELIGVVVLVRREAEPYSDEHIALVQAFSDQAGIAVANARLMEAVERQRTELARFVSPPVAELISSRDGEQLLAGHRAYISCLFCDLRGFTAFAETAAPEELFDVLRQYHGVLGNLIPEYEGTLEHFASDGVMVFFNDPVPVADHELQAVRLALEAQERFEELALAWRKRGTELGLGIGIESGYATLGRIGFEGRYDYGVLGPVANLASRLSTRAAAGQILIGQRLFAAVEAAVETAPAGELELKGFSRPVAAYEVRGLRR
ncbi:MAG TPA: GAF domain-containing protein [Gaiellaceae bacterium]|jgi:adenylate cyclase|nr:GAF domain-containing protein [Gaiellaceae bacterium]